MTEGMGMHRMYGGGPSLPEMLVDLWDALPLPAAKPRQIATTSNNIQTGDNNTQINAENFTDNSQSIKQQHVLGSIQLDNANIQQLIQNRFSGPISIQTASIAGTSSVFTAFSAATDLVHSADRLQKKIADLDGQKSEVESALQRFQSLLQQLCDSFANAQQEHRRDLLTLQDYFVVLMQAQRLLIRIDKDVDDHKSESAADILQTLKQYHLQGLDVLNTQLSNQVNVLTSASYTVAQECASKVMQVGDENAIQFYDVLSNINRQVQQAQAMLRSFGDQPLQVKQALNSRTSIPGRPDFEEALRNSPAYARLSMNYRSSARFSSSTRASSARSLAWPALDLVSLANVSIISVIGLPVSWDSLDNSYDELASIAEEVTDDAQASPANGLLQRSLSQRVREVTGYAAIPRRQNLYAAVDEGNDTLVKRLLSFGVRPDYSNPVTGRTPLAQAVYRGNLDLVRALLAAHPLQVNDHPRPLALAVKGDHLEIAKELLAYRLINVNHTDEFEVVPLHLAVDMDLPEMVATLLTKPDLEVNCINRRFQTPLEVAVTKGCWQIVKLLVEDSRTDVNNVWIRENALNSAIQGDHLAIVEILLSLERIDAESKDSQGRKPLVAAIECGHSAIAQALIASGKAVLTPWSSSNDSPLYAAIKKSDVGIMEALLHRAGSRLDEAVYVLIEDAIDANISFDLARIMSKSVLRDVLEPKSQSAVRKITSIIKHGHMTVVKDLLAAKIFDHYATLINSLKVAAGSGQPQIAKYLLENTKVMDHIGEDGERFDEQAKEKAELQRWRYYYDLTPSIGSAQRWPAR